MSAQALPEELLLRLFKVKENRGSHSSPVLGLVDRVSAQSAAVSSRPLRCSSCLARQGQALRSQFRHLEFPTCSHGAAHRRRRGTLQHPRPSNNPVVLRASGLQARCQAVCRWWRSCLDLRDGAPVEHCHLRAGGDDGRRSSTHRAVADWVCHTQPAVHSMRLSIHPSLGCDSPAVLQLHSALLSLSPRAVSAGWPGAGPFGALLLQPHQSKASSLCCNSRACGTPRLTCHINTKYFFAPMQALQTLELRGGYATLTRFLPAARLFPWLTRLSLEGGGFSAGSFLDALALGSLPALQELRLAGWERVALVDPGASPGRRPRLLPQLSQLAVSHTARVELCGATLPSLLELELDTVEAARFLGARQHQRQLARLSHLSLCGIGPAPAADLLHQALPALPALASLRLTLHTGGSNNSGRSSDNASNAGWVGLAAALGSGAAALTALSCNSATLLPHLPPALCQQLRVVRLPGCSLEDLSTEQRGALGVLRGLQRLSFGGRPGAGGEASDEGAQVRL